MIDLSSDANLATSMIAELLEADKYEFSRVDLGNVEDNFQPYIEAVKYTIIKEGYESNTSNLTITHISIVGQELRKTFFFGKFNIPSTQNSFLFILIKGPEAEIPIDINVQYVFDDIDISKLRYMIRGPQEQVYLIGNRAYLGSWRLDRAIPLRKGESSRGGQRWHIEIPVIKDETIEFKFVQKHSAWEGGSNRVFTEGKDSLEPSDDRFRD